MWIPLFIEFWFRQTASSYYLSLRVCYSHSPGLKGIVANLGKIISSWTHVWPPVPFAFAELRRLVFLLLGGCNTCCLEVPSSEFCEEYISPDLPLHLVKWTSVICTVTSYLFYILKDIKSNKLLLTESIEKTARQFLFQSPCLSGAVVPEADQ